MQHPNTNLQDPIGMHELREITEILIKHHGLHEGLYDLALEFGLAIGAVGPNPAEVLPGVMIGVKHIGIVKTDKTGHATADAAAVNPLPSANKHAAKKAPVK
jgi:hypothetical protein